jgi:hypothetical protein
MSQTADFNIFPLYCAPNIGWIHAFLLSENPKIVNDVKFVKQTFRNRFVYGTFQGPKEFSIPIKGSTKHLTYSEVEIDYQSTWQRQFLQSMKSAYGKSPFYEFYDYKIESIISKKHVYLWDLNIEILDFILKSLKVEKDYKIESNYFKKEAIFEMNDSLKYYQVFSDKVQFMSNLSVFDILFNEGIDALSIILKK